MAERFEGLSDLEWKMIKIFVRFACFSAGVLMSFTGLMEWQNFPGEEKLECRRLEPEQVDCKVISRSKTRQLKNVKQVYKKYDYVNSSHGDGAPRDVYKVFFVTGNQEVNNFFADHTYVSLINNFINSSEKILILESDHESKLSIELIFLSIVLACIFFASSVASWDS